jgi:uncharacterized protein
VRHHDDLGKLELAADELERALVPAERRAIVQAIRSAGYTRVAIDPEPFRSGSLNAAFLGRTLTVVESR